MSIDHTQHFTPRVNGSSEIPIDALRQALLPTGKPIDLDLINGVRLHIGLPPTLDTNGQTSLTIPNQPHAFMVDSLRLSCAAEGQDIHMQQVMVLFCHGTRVDRHWQAGDDRITQTVWAYNNWVDESKVDLPKIGVIISCNRDEAFTQTPGFDLKGELTTRRVLRDDSSLPAEWQWIPDVTFASSGYVYIDDARVDASGVSMSVSTDRKLVRVTSQRKAVRA